MDTETSAVPEPSKPKPVTHLKIPFGDGVVRSTPFESRHAVALAMAKHLRSDASRLDAILSLLAQVIHPVDYPDMFEALIDRAGQTTEQDVFKFLRDLVEATAKLNADRAAAGQETTTSE